MKSQKIQLAESEQSEIAYKLYPNHIEQSQNHDPSEIINFIKYHHQYLSQFENNDFIVVALVSRLCCMIFTISAIIINKILTFTFQSIHTTFQVNVQFR